MLAKLIGVEASANLYNCFISKYKIEEEARGLGKIVGGLA
jgi:hypothetical protein